MGRVRNSDVDKQPRINKKAKVVLCKRQGYRQGQGDWEARFLCTACQTLPFELCRHITWYMLVWKFSLIKRNVKL